MQSANSRVNFRSAAREDPACFARGSFANEEKGEEKGTFYFSDDRAVKKGRTPSAARPRSPPSQSSMSFCFRWKAASGWPLRTTVPAHRPARSWPQLSAIWYELARQGRFLPNASCQFCSSCQKPCSKGEESDRIHRTHRMPAPRRSDWAAHVSPLRDHEKGTFCFSHARRTKTKRAFSSPLRDHPEIK